MIVSNYLMRIRIPVLNLFNIALCCVALDPNSNKGLIDYFSDTIYRKRLFLHLLTRPTPSGKTVYQDIFMFRTSPSFYLLPI